MKKILCLTGALLVFFAAESFAGCTLEDFQKELATMQTLLTEQSQNPEKFEAMNKELMGEFQGELEEFQKMMTSVGSDQEKMQAMLDKGCDLYSRFNKKLAEMK